MGPALILLLVVVVVAAVAGISFYLKQQRRQGFATMARQLGLEYSAEDPFGLLGRPFALFERGDGRGIENVLSGDWQGVSVRAFDFWYYDTSTDSNGNTSKTYHRFDCAIVPVDASCPRLTIDHETVLTRLADAVALRDIEFESEAFNRAYNVKGKDRAFATAFVDARMMAWLLEAGAGYAFEVLEDQLLVSHRRLRPAELVPLIGTAKAFGEHVPRVVASLYPRGTSG